MMNGTGTGAEASGQAKAPETGTAKAGVPKRPPSTDYREKFKREFIYVLWGSAACFILGALIAFTQSPASPFLATSVRVLLFAAAGGCAFLVLRPIRVPCAECDAKTSSFASWVCGTCKSDAHRPYFSFLNCCPTCRAAPKLLFCSACGEKLYLTHACAEKPYAYLKGKTDPLFQLRRSAEEEAAREKAQKYQERAERKREKQEEQEDKFEGVDSQKVFFSKMSELYEVELRYLNIKAQRDAKVTPPKPEPTLDEKLEGDLDKEQTHDVAAHRAATKRRSAIDEEFKNNPEVRARLHKRVDEWLVKVLA
jgi:hypothetical protein